MAEARGPRGRTSFDFGGTTVLVTGASRGIGRSLALAFANAGADLVLTARGAGALDEVAAEARAHGVAVRCLALDQRDVNAVRDTLAQIGPVDVLVNNAGVEEVRPSLEVDEALWDRIVGTNLKGAFFTAQAAAAIMARNGGGAIVNLASLTSFVGVPTATPYGASKTGVLGMTRALAAEWGPLGIRVNAIAPGYFETDMTRVFYEDRSWVESMVARIPMGRLGALEDLSGAVQFLASDSAAYVNGECLVIDGGFLAKI
ncbi:SDR family NAD(P)-dependent oxidoreductase [Roseisalinus antarcticus]|uniref:Gluconate 5-dehydrogenase n=1 Tax=Roseisalinus antarcticus TaxID=254357 RepID=A0A1Y5RHZ1_9RHOB|nr:glucose 1-dehydrogenase [Roseisalinus antarcticus]SLN15084.1 Gluconate 5-dehydrogenase [Roseisalinus antarcticus]